MQQGDIVVYYKDSLKDAKIGLAYDSKLVVTADWRGVHLVTIKMLRLGNERNINVYRTTSTLSHARKTRIRDALIDIGLGYRKLSWRERINFSRFIVKLYHDIINIEVTDNEHSYNLIKSLSNSTKLDLVESYSALEGMRI